MAERTVAQKLQVKSGDVVAVVAASDDDITRLGVLPEGARLSRGSTAGASVAIVFVTSRAELLERFASELRGLESARAVWFCYPKGNRADLNRDTIIRESSAFGWRPNSNVAVDDTWSAVRVRQLETGEAPVG
ncbi:MAG TPA: hypothetical protein VGI08_05950 [Diaminobutyricibacter sp.]|uniref:hypothetical protein n=1 Tax=Leifsonia sp. McL0618 TaxID=3415677 RepID=UPI0033837EBE